MAGNSNSGRKSFCAELKHKEVLFKSEQIILDALNDETFPKEEKRKMALALYIKSIPQVIAGDSNNPISIETLLKEAGEHANRNTPATN